MNLALFTHCGSVPWDVRGWTGVSVISCSGTVRLLRVGGGGRGCII